MPVGKYKSALVLTAVQWTGDNHDEVMKFLGAGFLNIQHPTKMLADYKCNVGDWLIEDGKGNCWGITADHFKKEYVGA